MDTGLSLHRLVTDLIVPPVDLAVLALVLIALVLLGPGRRWARCGALACIGLLLVLGMPAVAATLLVSLERGVHPVLAPAAPEAIVVLGAEVDVDRSGEAIPGPLSLERVRAAAALARRSLLPVLLSGGVVRDDAPPVAMVMARSLRQDFGVTPRWVEAASVDTWGNAVRSAALLRPQGIGSVFVVTQAWHMRRAMIAFRHAGLPAVPAPVLRDRPPAWDAAGMVPTAGGWLTSYYALHEWIGCAWYGLRARSSQLGWSHG